MKTKPENQMWEKFDVRKIKKECMASLECKAEETKAGESVLGVQNKPSNPFDVRR